MATRMMEGSCPHCGKLLQIPGDLQDFSCLYCGKRMTKEELVLLRGDVTVEDALAYVKAHILACVENGDELRNGIRKDQYVEVFAKYEAAHRETFCRMDNACRTAPEQKDQILMQVVETFLGQLEVRWKGQKKDLPEKDKVVVAIYMVPAIRHLKLTCGDAFCNLLQAEWIKRYPKSPFYVGDYETLVGSFQKKILGLCYITTAVCEWEGKPDDCEELTAFRAFRDGYLRSCSDGEALIREYYDTAPAIITMISVCGNAEKTYGEIRERWLNRCYSDLQQGRMEECKVRYTDMVRTLQKKYLH